jgi:hypothetical protein
LHAFRGTSPDSLGLFWLTTISLPCNSPLPSQAAPRLSTSSAPTPSLTLLRPVLPAPPRRRARRALLPPMARRRSASPAAVAPRRTRTPLPPLPSRRKGRSPSTEGLSLVCSRLFVSRLVRTNPDGSRLWTRQHDLHPRPQRYSTLACVRSR